MNERRRSMASQLAKICRFLIKVGLTAAVACAVVGGIYLFNRVDEGIRVHVEKTLGRHFDGLIVSVRSARLLEREGIEIRGLSISERPEDAARTELLYVDEIHVRCQPTLQGLLERDLNVRDMTVRRVTIRATRRSDGTWNIARLFPLPQLSKHPPPTTIENATIEIVDATQKPASLLTFRNINLRLTSPTGRTGSELAATEGHRKVRIEGALAGDHIRRAELHGEMDLTNGAWAFQGKVEELAISPDLRGSLPRSLRCPLDRLGSLTARGTFDFQVQGQTPPWSTVQYKIDGTIRDGRMDDKRLGYPLTDLQAVVHMDNRWQRIEDATARYGPATFRVSCFRDGNLPTSRARVSGNVTKLHMTSRLVDLLPPTMQQQWHKFRPLGSLDADFRFDFDGRQWKPELTVTCLDMALVYDRFPYPLERGAGKITLKNDVLTVSDFQIIAGETPIDIRASIQHPGPDWSGRLDLKSLGTVPLDSRLIEANQKQHQRLIRDFSPSGGITVDATFKREAFRDAPVQKEWTLQLRDGSVQHGLFPYPLDRLKGTLHMKDGQWRFEGLEGHNDGAVVLCQGSWNSQQDGGRLKLRFSARDVELEDELKLALHARARQLWEDIRPRGALDRLEAEFSYSPRDRRSRLHVQLIQDRKVSREARRNISIHPRWFPYRIDQLTGLVDIQDGQVTLNDMRGVHGAVLVTKTNATASFLPRGDWKLSFHDLNVDRLQPDRELIQALPKGLRSAISGLNLTGPINLNGRLELAGTSSPETPIATNWDVTLNAVNGGIDCGLTLEHVTGAVRLAGRSDGQGFYSRGNLELDSLIYRGIQLTELRSPLWLDDDRLLLGAWVNLGPGRPREQLRAKVFGGTLVGDAEVQLEPNIGFHLQAILSEADLAQIVRDTSRRPTQVRGRAGAVLQLSGNGDGMHSLRGGGQILLRDADIYRLPIMVAVLKILRAEPLDRTAFTTSDMSFRVEADNVYFDPIVFSGDAISLKGKGDMSLDGTREIRLDFYSLIARERDYLPVVRQLIGEASRRFLVIHVTGTLDNPQTMPEVLPVVNETLQQIFPEAAAQLERRGSAARLSRSLSRPGWIFPK